MEPAGSFDVPGLTKASVPMGADAAPVRDPAPCAADVEGIATSACCDVESAAGSCASAVSGRAGTLCRFEVAARVVTPSASFRFVEGLGSFLATRSWSVTKACVRVFLASGAPSESPIAAGPLNVISNPAAARALVDATCCGFSSADAPAHAVQPHAQSLRDQHEVYQGEFRHKHYCHTIIQSSSQNHSQMRGIMMIQSICITHTSANLRYIALATTFVTEYMAISQHVLNLIIQARCEEFHEAYGRISPQGSPGNTGTSACPPALRGCKSSPTCVAGSSALGDSCAAITSYC